MTKHLDCVKKDGFLDSELFPRMSLSAFREGMEKGLRLRGGYKLEGYEIRPKIDEKTICRFYVSKKGGSN